MIKVVIILFGVSATLALLQESEYGDTFLQLTKKAHATCVSQTGVDESLIEGVKKGSFPNEKTIKSYTRCALNELKVMDDNGDISKESLLTILPEKVKSKKTDESLLCIAKNSETDLDQRGYNFVKCVHDLSPEDFIFF